MRYLAAITALALSGCAFESSEPECLNGSDCEISTPCEDDVCESARLDSGVDAFVQRDTGVASDLGRAPDTGSEVPDMLMSPDTGAVPDTAAEADLGTSSCVSEACTPDRFEPNDGFATIIDSTVAGCDFDEMFVPADVSIDASICPGTDVDRWELGYLDCYSRSFVVRIDVEPTRPCHHTEYLVTTPGIDCDDDNVRCTDLPGGARRIEAIISPNQNPTRTSVRVWVESEPGVTFDYSMRVQLI